MPTERAGGCRFVPLGHTLTSEVVQQQFAEPVLVSGASATGAPTGTRSRRRLRHARRRWCDRRPVAVGVGVAEGGSAVGRTAGCR